MFKNYLKMILRNMRKHKLYSFINISGLTVSIACSLMIVMHIRFETSHDKYHRDADRIYRIGIDKDLIVRTRSEKVDEIRKMILEFLLAHAPCSPQLQDLAEEYGSDKDRFEKESSSCILCGLCVRYCAEVKKKNAVGFVDCGARREIRFIPEIALKECDSCKECFPLCPTSYLQATYLLTQALASSRNTSEPR